jgi:hypothetical protein
MHRGSGLAKNKEAIFLSTFITDFGEDDPMHDIAKVVTNSPCTMDKNQIPPPPFSPLSALEESQGELGLIG